MNYHKIYSLLMRRAQARVLVGYSETHHWRPRCLGGTNDPRNIVELTPEEHYLAHLLLVRIYPEDSRLLWAAVQMTNGNRYHNRKGNKLYGWLRRKLVVYLKQRGAPHKFSDESREKMRLAKLGKKRGPHSAATKRKMSEAAKGKPKSAEHRRALAKAHIGNKNALGDHDLSNLHSPKYRQMQAKKMREIWKLRRAGKLPMPVPKSS